MLRPFSRDKNNINNWFQPFIAEITPPTYRGVTGGMFQNGINFGIFVCLLISPYLDWRVLTSLGLISGSLMGVGLLFMKESPVWLLSNNLIDKYQHSAAFYAGNDHVYYANLAPPVTASVSSHLCETVPQTLTLTKVMFQTEAGEEVSFLSKWRKLVRNPQTYKPLFLCMFMSLAFQLSAATVIAFYNVAIFTNAG